MPFEAKMVPVTAKLFLSHLLSISKEHTALRFGRYGKLED